MSLSLVFSLALVAVVAIVIAASYTKSATPRNKRAQDAGSDGGAHIYGGDTSSAADCGDAGSSDGGCGGGDGGGGGGGD